MKLATSPKGDEIRIWAGHPSYDKKPLVIKPGKHELSLHEKFGRFEGDFVIQLMDKGILLDEYVVSVVPGESRRISTVQKTKPAIAVPPGMVKIPAGNFQFKGTYGDAFISYPKQDVGEVLK